MAADDEGPVGWYGAPDKRDNDSDPKRTRREPPPPNVLSLGNGEAMCAGTAADMLAAATWLARNYPDGLQGEPFGPWSGPVLNMGYLLRRMIRDGAPMEWTPLMRLVASEIADDARDPDASGLQDAADWPWSAIPIEGEIRRGAWRDGLVQRTGMSSRAISRVLADLAAAGYEMRTPITDRDGKPVRDKRGRLLYAARGHALRFQVPPLMPRPELESSPDSATNESDLWITTRADSSERCADPPAQGESSPDPASINGERSPLLARKVAGFGDPVSSVSPHENQSPQTVVPAAQPEVEGGYGGEPEKPAIFYLNSRASSDTEEPAVDPAEHQRRELDRLAAWIRDHPETVTQ